MYDGEILDNIKYAIYRKNRNLDRIDKKDGGGVLCTIRKVLTSSMRDELEVTDLELLWMEMKLANKRIFIGTLYLPCKCNVETLIREVEYFS